MKNKFFNIDTLAASGSEETSTIELVRTRSLSITAKMTFGGSIDADATIDVYYSPDGKNWDSLAYTSFALTFTVSATRQKTVPITVPEHGAIKLKVTNGSSADTIKDLGFWFAIHSWPSD